MLKSIDIYLGIIIMMCGIIGFAKIVLNENIKVSKLKLTLIIILSSIVYTLTYLHLTSTIKTLTNCILQIITFKYLFKIDYPKSILLTIIYVILLIIPEMIELFTFTAIFKIDKVYFYNNIAGGLISNLIICVLFITLTIMIRKYLNKLINYKIETNKKIIMVSILTLLCVLVVFYNAFSNIELNVDLIASIFTMVIFVMILIILIKQTVENNNLTKKYEQVLEFMTTYEDEVEKQRVLRHEIKNVFLTIKAQITDKSKEKEIIAYIDSILKEDTKIKYEEYAKFKYLPANGIKGLCYYKVQEAENKGIRVAINISSRLSKSIITKLSIEQRKELGKILGVFLDNAIYASAESEDKILGLEAYVIENNVKLIISNSYKGKIDTNKLGKEKYTTKGKKHGHGLLLVKSIISNNKIFETTTEITDKLYIQNIIIKKPTEQK